MRGRERRGERGAVSVEFALLIPVFLVLIAGAVHFGSVIQTRHRLTDAANFAVRAATVRRTPAAGAVQALLTSRLGSAASDCTSITVTSSLLTDATGLQRLEVEASCVLAPPFDSDLLGSIGPDRLTVEVAMPY